MPQHTDPHARQARVFAVAFVALICLIVAGTLAIVG